ncbi:MAG: DUF1707 domain-containing protein [Gemmatimonadota bacterium]
MIRGSYPAALEGAIRRRSDVQVCTGQYPIGYLAPAVMTGTPSSSNGAAIAAATTGPTLSERERVVDLLQLRFADDHLSLDEFERRVAAAYQTRTAAELDDLVADLTPATTLPAVTAAQS